MGQSCWLYELVFLVDSFKAEATLLLIAGW